MPRSIFVILVVLVCILSAIAQDVDYYSGIDKNAKDDDLKKQLQDLVSVHTVLTYDDAWGAFAEIDKTMNTYPCDSSDPSMTPDVYSGFCWKNEGNVTTGGECGNYKKEGDCFNREHIFPKSWFGGFSEGANAQTDLFELWASDGYVNGLRGNLPFGPITCAEDASYTSTNGVMIGPCDPKQVDPAAYDGKCFEPPLTLKGDFARSYFYLSTAYWNKWACCDGDANNGSDIKPWLEQVLRAWHELDPVDDAERARNDLIYKSYQNNRNPFIDYPEFVAQISDF